MKPKDTSTIPRSTPRSVTVNKKTDNQQVSSPPGSFQEVNRLRRPKQTLASQIKNFFDPTRAQRKQQQWDQIMKAEDKRVADFNQLSVSTPFNAFKNAEKIVRAGGDKPSLGKSSDESIIAKVRDNSSESSRKSSSKTQDKKLPVASHPSLPTKGNSPQSTGAIADPEVNALLALVADIPDDAAKRLLFGGKATASAPFTPARPVFSGTERNLDDVAYRAPTNDSNFGSGIRGHLYQTLTARTSGPAVPEGKLHSVDYSINGKDGDKLNSASVDIATLKRELGSVGALRFSEKSSTNFALSVVNHLNSTKESPLRPISTDNLKVSWAIERNPSGALTANFRISAADSGVVIEGDVNFPDQSKSIGLPVIQAPFEMWKAGRALAATQLPSAMLVSDVTQPKHVYTRTAHLSGQEAKPIASLGGKPGVKLGVKLDDDDLTSLAAQGRSTRLPPFHGVPIVAHEQPLAIDAQEAMAEFKDSAPLSVDQTAKPNQPGDPSEK